MSGKIVKVIPLVPGVSTDITSIAADMLTREVFWTEYVSKHKPLIIKGGAQSWPAIDNWSSPGYLEEHCNNEQVYVSRTFNPVPAEHYGRFMLKRRSLKESLLEMRDAQEHDTYSIPAQLVPEGWNKDLKDYAFLPPEYNISPRIHHRRRVFIYKNASTEWHYHATDETLTTQLLGKKNISLFRLSSETWDTYAKPIEANFHHMSCRERFFPEQQKISKYHATLEPGDVLYLPPFWWHGIDPADTGIGATLAHCFRTPMSRLADWSEPITKANLRNTLQKNQILFTQLALQLMLSSASRAIKGEPWVLAE